MNENIYNHNLKYFKDWFSINPNLKGLKYENNILTSPDGSLIDIKDYLIEDLLSIGYFYANKYTMTLEEFLSVLQLNLMAHNLLSTFDSNNDKIIGQEYVINFSPSGVIQTNLNNYFINQNDCKKALMIYSDITLKYNHYIPINLFIKELKTIGINVSINDKNPNFLFLINKQDSFTPKEKKYIKDIADLTLKLSLQQELIGYEATKLIHTFEIEAKNIEFDNIEHTENQKYILSLYNRNAKVIDDEIKKEEEKLNSSSPSLGFSSLSFILASVISASLATLFLIYFS